MTDYWIKLYNEILDDPKVATLPDRIWRRMVELFLVAGRLNGSSRTGELPETKQIAWVLRLAEDELELDLQAIEKTGIIEKTETGWRVVNFEKRQAASTDAERKARQRERDHKEQYYVTEDSHEVVTFRDTDTDTDTEADTEAESEAEAAKTAQSAGTAAVFGAFQSNIGLITPVMRDKLLAAEADYGAEWVNAAISEAVSAGVRRWNYVEAILDRWRVEGFKSQRARAPAGYGKNGKPRGVPDNTPEGRAKYGQWDQERTG